MFPLETIILLLLYIFVFFEKILHELDNSLKQNNYSTYEAELILHMCLSHH